MYGDDDIDLDALLDDAVNEVVVTAPLPVAVHPAAPLASSSNPVTKTLSEAGLPAAVAQRWATSIIADQGAQVRLGGQRPLSKAYKAWEEKGYGVGVEEEDVEGGGWSGGSVAQKGRALFGDALQLAASKAKLKPKSAAQVTAALHGKDADRPVVDAIQRLYLECLAKDATARLRSDPDRKAARLEDPTRFPHIARLLDGLA